MHTPTDPAFRISAARLQLMQHRACGLLAELGNSLHHTPDETIPTLCTDGRQVKYCPAFVAQLSDADLQTALLHEYAHVALLHPVRYQPHHDKELANRAMDYAVNQWIVDAGRTLPDSWLFDARFEGMSWEAIYTAMMPPPPPPQPEQPEQPEEPEGDDDQENDPDEGAQDEPQPGDSGDSEENNDGQGNDPNPDEKNAPAPANDADQGDDQGETPADGPAAPGKPGDRNGDVQPMPTKDGHAADEQQRSEQAAELTDRVARIAQAQEMTGHGNAGSKRFLDSLTTPRDPDLYEALAQLLERAANDHTWRKPNRRLLHAGIFPGLDGEECPPLVIAVDTSGSIDDRILAAFSDKVLRAVADFRPRAVTVIYCDDRINGEPETFTADDVPALTPHGGGGTDFRPPFAWVDAHLDEQPAALVYLTDLDGDFPTEPPAYPVIWASIPGWRQSTAPFGQTVPLIL